MSYFLWVLMLIAYVICCAILITLVLLQKGKGTGFGGAFGIGTGSDTIFGPKAGKSLPQRLTYISAGVFMSLALVMSLLSGHILRGSAPDKVDGTAVTTTDGAAQPKGMVPGLEDLGSAVTGASVPEKATAPASTESKPAAPAPATPAPATPAPAPATPAPATPAPAPAPAAPSSN